MRKAKHVLLAALVTACAIAVYAQSPSTNKKAKPEEAATAKEDSKPDALSAFMRVKLDTRRRCWKDS